MTLLDSFIRENSIDVVELLRLTKLSEQHLARLRDGRTEPSKHVAESIAAVCSWLAHRKVYVWEIFERLP